MKRTNSNAEAKPASNPFTIAFGTIPTEHILRLQDMETIIDSFRQNVTPAYMISGVRGSGKTVLLADISARLREEGWIVVDLNPTVDMLQGLAAKLYDAADYKTEFIKSKINLSALGIGVDIEEIPPVADYETAISRMLSVLKKKGKKVLIVVDEASNSTYMRQMVSAFQILIRNGAPIYLLMTGLYRNLHSLQNSNEITFLLRTPRIFLEPLRLVAIKDSYERIFQIDGQTASRMATLTKGYAYAYQVLGYLYWNAPGDVEEILPTLDTYLQDFVYSKIWTELSNKDRQVITEIAKAGGTIDVATLQENVGMNKGTFSMYRQRAKQKGLIDTARRGVVSFSLPRFETFAATMADLEEI